MQSWNNDLEESSRAGTYRTFCNFSFQSYLNSSCISIEKYRIAFNRFRLSSHTLEIESRRWHKPEKIPYQERKCKLCNTLEDEIHFLLKCPMFSNSRKTYIKKCFWKRPSMIRFVELMNSENKEIIINVYL